MRILLKMGSGVNINQNRYVNMEMLLKISMFILWSPA